MTSILVSAFPLTHKPADFQRWLHLLFFRPLRMQPTLKIRLRLCKLDHGEPIPQNVINHGEPPPQNVINHGEPTPSEMINHGEPVFYQPTRVKSEHTNLGAALRDSTLWLALNREDLIYTIQRRIYFPQQKCMFFNL